METGMSARVRRSVRAVPRHCTGASAPRRLPGIVVKQAHPRTGRNTRIMAITPAPAVPAALELALFQVHPR
jgi:hypothetical protein